MLSDNTISLTKAPVSQLPSASACTSMYNLPPLSTSLGCFCYLLFSWYQLFSVNAAETRFHDSTLLEVQVTVFTTSVFQVHDSTTCPACKEYSSCKACTKLLHHNHCADMWDTDIVRQTSPVGRMSNNPYPLSGSSSMAGAGCRTPGFWADELRGSSNPVVANDPVHRLPWNLFGAQPLLCFDDFCSWNIFKYIWL